MPFFIKPPIHIPGIGFIAPERNAEINTMIGKVLRQFPLAIRFVGQHRHIRPQFDSFQHFLSHLYIMRVSCRKLVVNWIAKSVHNDMNLGAFARSPAPLWILSCNYTQIAL